MAKFMFAPCFLDGVIGWRQAVVNRCVPTPAPLQDNGAFYCPDCSGLMQPNCDLVQLSTIDDPLFFSMFICDGCERCEVFIYRHSEVPNHA
jgi:hypothetical protein